MPDMDDDSRAKDMSSKYVFPYHHLPLKIDDRSVSGRDLRYGLSYLGYLTAVIEEVRALQPRRVLEVGCGDGRFGSELMRRGTYDYVGVDIDERATIFARAFTYGTSAEILYSDIRNVDRFDFDVAVLSEVLEHIPLDEIVDFLTAIHRRLRPGGHLVVTVPSDGIPPTAAHYRHYSAGALVETLAPLFSVEKIKFLNRRGLLLRVCERLLTNRFFSLKEPLSTRLVSILYDRYLLNSDERHASQVLAVVTKNE